MAAQALKVKIIIITILAHQFGLGQMTLVAVAEHVNRQLQGQRTYFFPGGGADIGYN